MTWIEAVAVIFGLVCVWLTIRQNIWCWPTGLVQVALYIVIFYQCETDIPYDDTWDRSGETNRQALQQQTKADLLARRIPYIALAGSPETRMQIVSEVLHGFDRFASIGDNLRIREVNKSMQATPNGAPDG